MLSIQRGHTSPWPFSIGRYHCRKVAHPNHHERPTYPSMRRYHYCNVAHPRAVCEPQPPLR
jgi:hypothetical protein